MDLNNWYNKEPAEIVLVSEPGNLDDSRHNMLALEYPQLQHDTNYETYESYIRPNQLKFATNMSKRPKQLFSEQIIKNIHGSKDQKPIKLQNTKNLNIFTSRFSYDQIPRQLQDGHTIILSVAQQETYQFYEPTSFLLPLQQKLQTIIKPDTQQVLICPLQQLQQNNNLFITTPQHCLACFLSSDISISYLSKEEIESLLQSIFNNAFQQLVTNYQLISQQKQNFILIQSLGHIPHLSPFTLYHALFTCLKSFLIELKDRQQAIYDKFPINIVFRPNSRQDEYLINQILSIYFPRNSEELTAYSSYQQANKMSLYSTQLNTSKQQTILQQTAAWQGIMAANFKNQEIFIKQTKKEHQLQQLEERLNNADLSQIIIHTPQQQQQNQLIVQLTSQFNRECILGVCCFNYTNVIQKQQYRIDDYYLWVLRNTGLYSTEQFTLVVFCGSFEIRSWVQQEVSKFHQPWLQRMRLIVVRAPTAVQQLVINQLGKYLAVYHFVDNIKQLRQKYPQIIVTADIQQWDQLYSD